MSADDLQPQTTGDPMQPLRLKRANGFMLNCIKTDNRYDISVTGGDQLTEGELQAIDAYIGDDPDGQETLRKLLLR